ncbi:MAG: AAA family ATPase [Chloroflexota bacterium]
MQIQKLTLTNVRNFPHAEFTFQPGMNLIVGVNGAGKSTILDALAATLSFALPRFTPSESRPFSLATNDITLGQTQLTIALDLLTADFPITCQLTETQSRASFRMTPDNESVLNLAKGHANQPFVAYFSTRRAYPISQNGSTYKSNGAYQFVYADALRHRPLNVREFAQWLLVQESLQAEVEGQATVRLAQMSRLAASFLPGYTNLQAIANPTPTLTLDREGYALDVRYLSDGERNLLSLILDLTRRLTQANPTLDNPIRKGKAVVLIDELDLHMHPSWQRTVVQRLTNTFPNCQFICTTHSPQIIGEVSPECITFIDEGQISHPFQSLGMDTNWIVRHLMGTPLRDAKTATQLEAIADLIEEEEYDEAEEKIDLIRNAVGDFPELVRLQTQIDMIDFWAEEFLAEEANNELEAKLS